MSFHRSPVFVLLVLLFLAIPCYVLLVTTEPVFAIIGALVVCLVLPPTLRAKSWKVFVLATIKVAFGVVLPPLVFFLGGLLTPEWKGGCQYGWIDCFHEGKFALFPIALWATAALYALEVWPVKCRDRYWIVWGFLNGAIVSTVCLVHGLFTINFSAQPVPTVFWELFFTIYVSAWYTFRTVQLLRSTKLRPFTHLIGVLCSVPFWIYSVILSKQEYLKLPDEPPDCFVVTAASRGHASIVGPFIAITRRGRARRANGQLITLWQFEDLWRMSAPKSHRLFRRIYNVWGRRATALIRNRWAADIAYVLIKPAELLARLLIAFARNPDTT